MAYLSVEHVIATRSYEFSYIYAESHWKYHSFEGYYICTCSFSKLRHKANQKVWKCSLIFPVRNSLVTVYENCMNNMLQSISNFWTARAIITIYTSKCAQMDPQQPLITSKLHSRCKKCDTKKPLGVGGYHPPLVTRRSEWWYLDHIWTDFDTLDTNLLRCNSSF